MDCCVTLILLLLGCSLNSCSHYPLRKYYYIDTKMSWTDAQRYCRENYTDLATIESMDDINMLKPDFYYSLAWIGLRDDPQSWMTAMGSDANSWRWSATGETSKTGYQIWDPSQPNNYHGDQTCVLMITNGKWNDMPCQGKQSFICYTVTNQNEKIYEFISTLKTWDSALEYCRQQHTDLAMIENSAENTRVFSVIPAGTIAWIGLYRLPWTWSDMSQSTFRNWLPRVPDNYGLNQFCAAENPKHYWDDKDCTAEFPFICHQVSKFMKVVRIKTVSDADLTDPAVNAQILQQLSTVLTSQGWTDFSLQWKILPIKQKKNTWI